MDDSSQLSGALEIREMPYDIAFKAKTKLDELPICQNASPNTQKSAPFDMRQIVNVMSTPQCETLVKDYPKIE